MHAVLKLDIHTASHILLQASQPAFSLEALAFSSVFAVFVHITGARFGKISEQIMVQPWRKSHTPPTI